MAGVTKKRCHKCEYERDTRAEIDTSLGRYFCRRCADLKDCAHVPAEERYSMGLYAGMLCDACWAEDGKNHDRPFDPLDAGERYEEEDS